MNSAEITVKNRIRSDFLGPEYRWKLVADSMGHHNWCCILIGVIGIILFIICALAYFLG
ncbi:MAG: hypothetical protein ACQET3_05500 [Promethearchaeati archaeon]